MGAFVIYYALAQLLLIHLHSAELFLRETAEEKINKHEEYQRFDSLIIYFLFKKLLEIWKNKIHGCFNYNILLTKIVY